VISQRWKWATVLGNAAIGAAELATGNLSTMAVTADGLHNAGDAVTYHMQADNILNKKLTEAQRTRRRKIAHWIIGASSMAIAAKAGIDLSAGHEGVQHTGALYAAGASLALNGALFGRLRRNQKRQPARQHSEHEHDLTKHFLAVDIPSAALAFGGALLQKYSVPAEQVAAIASGLVGAWAFRPTKANLEHHCLDHDHTPPPASGHDTAGLADRHPSFDWASFETRLERLEARLLAAERQAAIILR
jgi:hypothetical protein